MALAHGQKSTLVTSTHVYGVSVNSATINTGTTGDIGSRGGYQISVTHDNVGCSSTGVLLELNDLVAWTFVTFEVSLTSYCSCWSFCTGNYVSAGGGNILSYNEGNGDRISRAFNSWELPQFQTHNRESACDNDSDNFFHGSFSVGDPKTFFMKRRRNVNGNRGGIALGRACTGPAGLTIIRNIRIW